MMTKRHIAITLGAAVLVAGVVAGRERPTLEIAAPRVAAPAADGIDLERLQRGAASLPQADPFARKSFEAPKQASNAPAKPAIPPLPFRYFGRLTDGGKTEVFVMRGDELVSIAPGQTLGQYRVEAVGETSIAFLYLPLNARQTLDLQ